MDAPGGLRRRQPLQRGGVGAGAVLHHDAVATGWQRDHQRLPEVLDGWFQPEGKGLLTLVQHLPDLEAPRVEHQFAHARATHEGQRRAAARACGP